MFLDFHFCAYMSQVQLAADFFGENVEKIDILRQ